VPDARWAAVRRPLDEPPASVAASENARRCRIVPGRGGLELRAAAPGAPRAGNPSALSLHQRSEQLLCVRPAPSGAGDRHSNWAGTWRDRHAPSPGAESMSAHRLAALWGTEPLSPQRRQGAQRFLQFSALPYWRYSGFSDIAGCGIIQMRGAQDAYYCR